MSSTGVKIGYGTRIRVGRGEAPTWTTLDGVGDVSFPVSEKDEHEVTHMQSPDGTKEYIPGLRDNGEVTVPVHYVPGSDTDTLLSEIDVSGETIQLEFTAANGGAPEAYAAFCKRYSRTAAVNGPMNAEAVFRVSGRILPDPVDPVDPVVPVEGE